MKATHLTIKGSVQGVGFRDWLSGEAQRLGLAGWVRNVGHDRVEALIAGETSAVEECLRLCRRGPQLASVESITDRIAEPPAEAGFHKLGSLPKG
jgi:acylphosphatase